MTQSTDINANPLLRSDPLPAYSAIKPAHIEPALGHVLTAQRAKLAELEQVAVPDAAWLQALEDVYEAVNQVWSPISHLNAVDSSPALREAYNACIPLVTDFYTDLGQNRALYDRFLLLRERNDIGDPVVRQIVRLGIRDFELAGVALEGEARKRYKDIMQAIASFQATFEQNIMDSTAAFSYHETDAEKLRGIPADFMERAASTAKEQNLEGWVFSLEPPTYQAIMSHAVDSKIREAYYIAWNTRASDQGPNAGQWDNGPLIEEILSLRREAAQILGFGSFAEQSVASKMASSTQEVIEFLRDLAKRSKTFAQHELERLASLAGKPLDPWDVGFYSERLKQRELQLSEEELRPYFSLDTVLPGLFELASRLFDIDIVEEQGKDTWHPSVRYFSLRSKDGAPAGGLFTDLFARPTKRGGAWMDVCKNNARIAGRNQVPIAHLVCNFNAPVGSTPSLLTHSDVVTLFHEFGHSIHHLLTEVPYPSLAGINGVAWDAVELPSQFLENYAFLPEVLERIARHYRTGEPLPAEKISTLQKSRTFLAGLAMLRQLEFALFDFLLHAHADALRLAEVRALLDKVRSEVAVIYPPEYHRFANSFSHIFAGGYAAGYYSYKWAEVLAADSFAAFIEAGVFDRATAKRFRESILAVGGSRDALDAFVDFRGRAPKLDALLHQSGILEDVAA
jgi:oligopeptidase A